MVGPVAQDALQRGYSVILVRDPAGAKVGDSWLAADALQSLPGIRIASINDVECDWFAGSAPCQNVLPATLAALRRRGVRIASLDTWMDSLGWPHPDTADLEHRTIRHGLIPTSAIPPRYAPRDLVWFVPKTRVGTRTQHALRWGMMLGLGWALRRLARAHRWRFVVKTRSKILLPGLLVRWADQVVGDTTLLPWASQTVLRHAALAVCHQSAAGWEAAAAYVPTLSVRLPIPHLRTHGTYPLMRARTASPYAWPGVIGSLSWEDTLRACAQDELDPALFRVDLDARQALADTWFGGRLTDAVPALLDRMEG